MQADSRPHLARAVRTGVRSRTPCRVVGDVAQRRFGRELSCYRDLRGEVVPLDAWSARDRGSRLGGMCPGHPLGAGKSVGDKQELQVLTQVGTVFLDKGRAATAASRGRPRRPRRRACGRSLRVPLPVKYRGRNLARRLRVRAALPDGRSIGRKCDLAHGTTFGARM